MCRYVGILIGHLQRNKVRELDHFALVHSIDRASIADAVSAFGLARKRSVDALVQVNVVGEQSKGGFAPEDIPAEAEQFITARGTSHHRRDDHGTAECGRARPRGRSFRAREPCARLLVSAGHPAFELSMGMSNDYELAVEEGATMIRLGTVLFGERGT